MGKIILVKALSDQRFVDFQTVLYLSYVVQLTARYFRCVFDVYFTPH